MVARLQKNISDNINSGSKHLPVINEIKNAVEGVKKGNFAKAGLMALAATQLGGKSTNVKLQ